ncbi:putative uncharacterized protein [Oscillibacter sp. CAG:155]|nr:putative uncharacterized protein [Oscillibacter sp. CAG:155]
MQAHLVLHLADGEAGKAALDDESGQPLVALGLVGHGKDHEHAGLGAVGDEDLGAVDHVVVALQTGLRLALGGIGTGIGLGDAHAAQHTALGKHGQVFALLLLGTVFHDGHAAQRVARHDVTGGGAGLGQLLGADGGSHLIGAHAAVLLGHGHAHDAQLEELGHVLGGILMGTVDLRSDGLDLVFREGAHHLLNQSLFTRERKIHSFFLPFLHDSSGTAPRL